MSSGLTLGQARALLPTAALPAVIAASASSSALYINAATSWLMSHGKWRDCKTIAVFVVTDNVQITLPRGMLSLLGVCIQGTGDNFQQFSKVQVTNEWYSWLPGGPGLSTNPPWSTSGMVAQGDGYVIFRDLPSAGTIKVYNTTTESVGSINIRGVDSIGNKVYTGVGVARIEGENVAMPTTANTSTTTATTWGAGNSLYAIVKPTTNGVINFYQVSADLTETLIGSYEPGEQNPCYHRYLVPQRPNNNGQVVALVQRRHVDVLVDNDQIIPGNLQALEMALMAVNMRRKADMALAQQYIAMAIDELNSELLQFEPEQSYGTLQTDLSVCMGTVPNLI